MEYKTVNGTAYKAGTPDRLIQVLEDLRQSQVRIAIDYGNPETNESWGEVHDTTGRISRSSGSIKIPILVHNRRSLGGCSILTDAILSIRESSGAKRLLYQHCQHS